MIKIYSSHTCPYCEKLERYFDSLDLKYDIHYIDDNTDDARRDLKELVALTGIAGVPVTVFESGEFVIGYDRENIDKQLDANAKKEKPAKSAKPKKVKVVRAVKPA